MRYLKTVSDLPQQSDKKALVLVTNDSVHVEAVGEWAPGHGYPANDKEFLRMQEFNMEDDEEEARLIKEIERLHKDRIPFRLIEIRNVTVNVQTQVVFSVGGLEPTE